VIYRLRLNSALRSWTISLASPHRNGGDLMIFIFTATCGTYTPQVAHRNIEPNPFSSMSPTTTLGCHVPSDTTRLSRRVAACRWNIRLSNHFYHLPNPKQGGPENLITARGRQKFLRAFGLTSLPFQKGYVRIGV